MHIHSYFYPPAILRVQRVLEYSVGSAKTKRRELYISLAELVRVLEHTKIEEVVSQSFSYRLCVPAASKLMADSSADPLTSLRLSIASNNPPIATTSSTPTDTANAVENLATATYLQFSGPEAHIFSLDIPTRFISSDQPVDLRSIYFAWQKKDVAIPDYIAATQELNEELGGRSRVQNLVFVERLDLITWLEGASEESEYIKVSDADSAARSAQVASGAAGGVSTVPSGVTGARTGRPVDPRLQEIYNGERRMGDRNSVLRGIKPTVSRFFNFMIYPIVDKPSVRISPTYANLPKSSLPARALHLHLPVQVLQLQ